MATRMWRRCWWTGIVVALLSGCAQVWPQTTLDPRGDVAWIIQDVLILVLVFAVLIFVAVEGALLYAVLRFRRRREDEIPVQTHGHTKLEIVWTIIPAIIIFILAVPTVGTVFATQRLPSERNPLNITVVGHQWWWEFRYPDLGIVTANEVHVPVGQTVVFTLESADVIHSFWVPGAGAKRDVVPRHKNTIWWTAYQPGEYYGQCAEYCGTSHADMRLRYFAQPPEEFAAWVAWQKRPAVEPAPGTLAERGKAVFLNPANQCLACHTVQGTIAQGKQGPDLTHFGSRTTLGSAILDNTPENLKRWIRKPSEFKPRTIMKQIEPAMARLSDDDMNALVAYLGSLR